MATAGSAPAKEATLEERVGAALKATQDKLDAFIEKSSAKPQLVTGAVPAHAPAVRRGENTLTSRGFQFTRLFGALTKSIPWEEATVEKSVVDGIDKLTRQNRDMPQVSPGYVSAPMGTELLFDVHYGREKLAEYRDLLKAGVHGADPDEMGWLMRKAVTGGQSYLDATAGGSLVGPPVYGEPIELLRNKAALIAAGSTVVALPPQGIVYPRITSATTGYWLGEKEAATASTFGTGTMALRPKKAVAFLLLPNELLRYQSVSSEAVARNDMMQTLSLLLDFAGIAGTGGEKQPLGILGTTGCVAVTPTTVATDGNTASPQDFYEFQSQTAENNAPDFTGYVMRPTYLAKLVEARSSVYNGSTTAQQGQFLFDQMRSLGQGFGPQLCGKPVTASANVPKNRVKGSGTTLTTVLGGYWPDVYIGMLGTLEFATTAEGYQLLQQDMTAIRAILTCDVGVRHPGAIAFMDNLLTSIGA